MSDDSMPRPEGCMAVANQELCVDADVEVQPYVHPGTARTRCVGPPVVDGCRCEDDHKCGPGCTRCGGTDNCKPKCHFTVRQIICVTVPLLFDAKVDANVSAVRCGIPKPGPCRD